MKHYLNILNSAFLVFVFLLPLKFTRAIGLPSVPATWPSDFATSLYFPWSTFAFCAVSAAFLLLYLLLPRKKSGGFPFRKNIPLLCLVALAAFCLLGGLNASCRVYVAETLIYMAGILCFAIALHLALKHTPEMKQRCLYSVACSTFLVALVGWDQHFSSLQMTREYVEQSGLSGQLSEGVLKQLNSARIFGPFQVCNTYAGYLAATIPIALYGVFVWIRNKFQTVKCYPHIRFLVLTFSFVFLSGPLWLTGSRGALFALFAAGALLLPFCLESRKKRLAVFGGYLVAGVLFFSYMLFFFRSPLSIVFRLDYDWAALKMMFHNFLCGAGWGEFFQQYPQMKCLINDETPHSPHNILLFFGSQAGFLAFTAAFCLIAHPVVEGFRSLWRKDGTLSPIWKIAFLSLLVMIFDFLLEIGVEVPACFATFLFLIAFVTSQMPQKCPTPECGRRFNFVSSVFAFALACCTLYFSVCAIRAESAYSDLYDAVNPQFATPEQKVEALEMPDSCKGNPYACAAMARHCVRTGDVSNAKAWLDRAISICPGDSSLYRQRMMLHLRLCDAAAAERDFKMLKKLEPHNPKLPNSPK